MKRIVHIFIITLLIKGLLSGCNQQPSKSFETPNDTVKSVTDTILKSSDTLLSVEPKRYTDVHCMLLINYPKISYGEYVYKKFSITADDTEFRIERVYRNGEINSWVIPYTKEEQDKYKSISDSNSKKTKSLKLKSGNFIADNYISTKETYTVNQTVYTIYKHIGFNCYDPFCGRKHGHTTERTGVTYFSPEYGILISKDDANMQYELLTSIKEREVPYDLIIDIMKQNKMDKRILNVYSRKVRSLKSKAGR